MEKYKRQDVSPVEKENKEMRNIKALTRKSTAREQAATIIFSTHKAST